jgi:hypothetical protein
MFQINNERLVGKENKSLPPAAPAAVKDWTVWRISLVFQTNQSLPLCSVEFIGEVDKE